MISEAMENDFEFVIRKVDGSIQSSGSSIDDVFLINSGQDGAFEKVIYELVDQNGKTACQISTISDTLFYNGKTYPWVWLASFLTDEAFRGRGLGTKLIQLVLQEMDTQNTGVGAYAATPVSIKIFYKGGMALAGQTKRFLLLKSVKPFLLSHVHNKVIISVLDAIYRSLFRIYGTVMKTNNKSKKYNAILTECRDIVTNKIKLPKVKKNAIAMFDETWQRIDTKQQIVNLSGNKICKVYIVYIAPDNDPIAYFIVREKQVDKPLAGRYKGFMLMSLMDFGFFQDGSDDYALVFSEAFKVFQSSESQVFEWTSNSQSLEKILKRRLFVNIGKGPSQSFVYRIPSNWPLDIRDLEMEQWAINQFSSDVFGI